ncbi:hypothetical protein ACQP3C_31280, partial [Escherichia coli]
NPTPATHVYVNLTQGQEKYVCRKKIVILQEKSFKSFKEMQENSLAVVEHVFYPCPGEAGLKPVGKLKTLHHHV